MKPILSVLVCTLFLVHATAWADVLLPGRKSVSHQMVFEDSELLGRHRIVAGPIAGLSGVAVIEPGVPFRFSDKYGTRIYLLPEDVVDVEEFDRERFAAWVSCPPPRSEMGSVVMTSAVARALTTVRLVSADASGLVVEEVSHVEFDGSGDPVTGIRSFQTGLILIAGGLVLCGGVLLVLRSRAKRRPDAASAAEPADAG